MTFAYSNKKNITKYEADDSFASCYSLRDKCIKCITTHGIVDHFDDIVCLRNTIALEYSNVICFEV